MVVQKGKVGTKGQKQIVEENKSTIKFYSIMSIASMTLYLVTILLVFTQILSLKYYIIIIFSGLVYFVCLSVLKYMAKTVYSSTGTLIDGGTDLNMENGFAENLKDLIILTAGVQTISLFSNYFWFLWLFAPFRAFYIIWVNFLGPWFFQAPPQEEVEDKKIKKMERKMRRNQ